MGEQNPSRNRDQHDPTTTNDGDVEDVEALIPDPNPVPHERRDIPEEETYERGRDHQPPDERSRSVPDR